jgi:hypothetical protein
VLAASQTCPALPSQGLRPRFREPGSQRRVLFVCLVFLRQGLTMYPRLAWDSLSFCLSLLSAGITGMYHHTWIQGSFAVQAHAGRHGWELVLRHPFPPSPRARPP